MHQDPHAVLGVPRTVSRSALKRAFRARARATHPDHGGNRTEFEAVAAAYETLFATAAVDVPRRLTPYVDRPVAFPRFCAYDSTRPTPPARTRHEHRDFAEVLAAAMTAAA